MKIFIFNASEMYFLTRNKTNVNIEKEDLQFLKLSSKKTSKLQEVQKYSFKTKDIHNNGQFIKRKCD